MRFKHSVSVTINNFSDVLKLLLYKLATGVVFCSIAYVILSLGLKSITGSGEYRALISEISSFINALFTGKTEVLQEFQSTIGDTFRNFMNIVSSHTGAIVGCLVGVGLVYLFSRFVNGLSTFAVGNSINDRMSAFARTRFSQAFFRGMGKAALYQLIYVPISFVYDALSVTACLLLFIHVPALLFPHRLLTFLFGVSLCVTGIVCLQALKLTIISAWMPKIITDGLPVGAAFRASFTLRKEFGRRFVGFLMAVYCIIGINVFAAVFTVGSALLITVPMSSVFILSMQFVNHYRANGKKYFVSINTIRGGEEIPEEGEL